jgi:ribonuclease D
MEQPSLIVEQADLDRLVEHLADVESVAFDTEFVPEYTFTPQLCLVQIATPTIVVAVDPLADVDCTSLWKTLTDPARELIVHAGKEELNFCQAFAGRSPGRWIDVQIAAGLAGLGYPLSLDNLLQKTTSFGRLKKTETRTDWRQRPLSKQQIGYALDDVRHLLEAERSLAARLRKMQRERWLEEETARFLETASRQIDDRWTRVPGSGNLRGRDLAVFRELVRWRDDRARKIDKPARWIVRDDLLVELARRQPRALPELQQLRGVGNVAQGEAARDLLAAVKRGVELPAEDWPKRPARRDLDDDQMVVKILSAALLQVAQSHNVAPALLGGNEDLRDFVQYLVAGEQAADPPKLGRGWRAEVCGPYFRDLLEGRVHLRIVATNGRLSLAFEERPTNADD